MADNYLRLYVHLVWATKTRLPLIEASWEEALYHEIHNEVNNVGAKVIALGGVADHIHLLLRFGATTSLAEMVKQIKGGSAFVINKSGCSRDHFQWQKGYAALTVSEWNLPKIGDYIRHQKQHHAAATTNRRFELDGALKLDGDETD